MRITNNMMSNTMLRNLNNINQAMDRSQDMLSSGKRIRKPSDDPVGIITALRLRTDTFETEQYLSNVDEARTWLGFTDTSFGQAGNILQRARELAVYGGNGSLPDESYQALAKEVDELIKEMVEVGNASQGGRHIFAGQDTTVAPFTSNLDPVTGEVLSVTLNGDMGKMQREISPGVTIDVNHPGTVLFDSFFTRMISFRDNLKANNTATISNVDVGNMDAALDDLLAQRAEVGAKVKRLDASEERLNDNALNLKQLLSKTEDADTAKVIMDLKMQENVQRAALSSGARIIQPTLVDFLR